LKSQIAISSFLPRQHGAQKRRNNPTRRRSRGRRPTEAAFFPRVLNPAPLFLLGAGSRRGTRTSEKSSRRDALLARQKRGAAVARFGDYPMTAIPAKLTAYAVQ